MYARPRKLLFPKTNLNFEQGQSFIHLFVPSALTMTLSLRDQPKYVPRASLHDRLVGQPMIKILTIES